MIKNIKIFGFFLLSLSLTTHASSSSVAQVDSDGNGVWDYIDEKIRDSSPETIRDQKILETMAVAIQKSLKYKEKPTKLNSNRIARLMAKASICTSIMDTKKTDAWIMVKSFAMAKPHLIDDYMIYINSRFNKKSTLYPAKERNCVK